MVLLIFLFVFPFSHFSSYLVTYSSNLPKQYFQLFNCINPGLGVLSYECCCVRRADSGLGDSHVLENSDHQEGTELETGLMSTMCHSTSGNAPSILMQRPCVEMETQTDFEHDFGAALSTTNHEFAKLSAVVESCCGANIKNSCATSQCDINEQESPKMEMKERVNLCVEPSSQSLCCDNADSSSEDPHCQAVYCDTRAYVDLMAVIDYDSETGTPVCVVDVDISPRISW